MLSWEPLFKAMINYVQNYATKFSANSFATSCSPHHNMVFPQHNTQEVFICGKLLFEVFSLDHYGVIRHMVHCPTQPVLMTCGEDCRIKFWGYSSS